MLYMLLLFAAMVLVWYILFFLDEEAYEKRFAPLFTKVTAAFFRFKAVVLFIFDEVKALFKKDQK